VSPRALRAVAVAAGLTLAVGLAGAVPSSATPLAQAGPRFVKVSATGAPAGRSTVAARTSTQRAVPVLGKVKTSSNEQILQVFKGAQGVGSTGLSVAAGPKQVVQLGGPAARIFTKATGAVKNKSTNQLFGISGVTLTEPTVVYDPVGKRWIIAAIADDAGDVSVAVRVSKGTTPNKWFPAQYFGSAGDPLETPADADIVESAPAIGVSSDKVAVTTVADDPTDANQANRIFFFPKTGSRGIYADGAPDDAWSAVVNHTYDGQRPAVNSNKQANLFIAVPDTNDVTVTTYTGAATTNPPAFSKNVTYPADALTPVPMVVQGGGDALDVGPLAFTGVAWRKGRLWAAATVNCSGDACVRVFGINTAAGVALVADETLESAGVDWFSPSLAVDGSGKVHLVAQDVGSAVGPSMAVFARKGANSWTAPRFVKAGTAVADPTGSATESWADSTAAAWDPTSPWDVWVTGVAGDSSVVPTGLTSRVARISLARNVATVKASATRVTKGNPVTFTVKLHRPDSKDVVKGLPVALQTKPVSGGSWRTLKSGKTSAKGVATWTVKVRKAALYRTLGKAVAQKGTPPAGRAVDKVTSKAVKVTLR
jgi:hypothetical protein